MPRAYPLSDYADQARDPGNGQWQALRGELVALLDKVESHYGPSDTTPEEPAMNGLARRVRNLRDQVGSAEPTSRHREALRSVKRAVDRFSERDSSAYEDEEADALDAAIAEIRSRQGAMVFPARRATDMPAVRELSALVGGMSQRLERLEGELKSQRANPGPVREVAGQVEQLTQVVELLAGAVGETGQVKRLEAQIGALAAMIEEAPKVDLAAINGRLDDVSATIGKLAELQAEQMEREVAREQRKASTPKSDPAEKLAPAMHAIEEGVRNVYDRIDAIERNVALSNGDFERLTSEMAAFTQAMKNNSGGPALLVSRVEALAQRLEGIDSADGNVAGLKSDIALLHNAVLAGMEPRFSKLENQIEALNERIVPVDTRAVEGQLKALMSRMDEAGAQLDGLARLYAAQDERPNLESLANLVAERTSDAVTRKAPAPVAMFGPESLKSIEDRLTGLIKSAGKTPDYEALAELVAIRTSEAMSKSAPAGGVNGEQVAALEQRMTALLNTTGKDTSERLARLEAMLTGRDKATGTLPVAAAPAMAAKAPSEDSGRDAFAEALQPREDRSRKLDAILAGLGKDGGDAMPANPSDEAPLVDPGFREPGPVRQALAAKTAPQASDARPVPPGPEARPHFDPGQVERPPQPRSSLAADDKDPFAAAPQPARPAQAQAQAEAAPAVSSTSTFVAAARRAQRARQEETETSDSNSLIGRALARVRNRKEQDGQAAVEKPADVAVAAQAEPRKPNWAERRAAKAEAVRAQAAARAAEADDGDEQPSFLTRHRRPLLLAATLVAVSMLALNLALQRMNQPSPTAAASVETSELTNPAPSDDQSSLVPPRVADLIDPVATASINPGEPMAFARASSGEAISTPLPPTLTATRRTIELSVPGTTGETVSPQTTGSIASTQPSATPAPETHAAPPEAVGPLALRDAAAKGDAKAQFEVAAIYGEGTVLPQDLQEAARWYERSAAQGFAPAQYRLGNLYEVGSGVEKDLEQARLWYQRGAEAGNRMAMHNLAALYAGGELGEQQFELAAEWFTRAAGRGMTDSQFNLGMLYARGLGVEQDFEQSYKWFSLAARNGDKDATQARDDIAKSLTAEAVGRINAEIGQWKGEGIDLAANYAPIGTWSEGFDPGAAITSRDVIARVQQLLNKLGFDVGTPDGVAGPKTDAAIRAFERSLGMNESGRINPRLLAVLGSQPA